MKLKANPMHTLDPIALVRGAAAITDDLEGVPQSSLEMMLQGAAGLNAALAACGVPTDPGLERSLGAEVERRKVQAFRAALANLDRAMFEDVGGIEVLDDLLAFLIDGMRQDISTMTSSELERVTAETGGRTIAMTFRSLATAELEWRLTGG